MNDLGGCAPEQGASPQSPTLKIAGFVPLSLCDYPGKVAAIIFTFGCNFRCPWCHNGHLLDDNGKPLTIIPEHEILERLEKYRNRVTGIVVSGGEPTVQPALPIFLKKLKALGMEVKLDSNGAKPEVLKRLIDQKLVDFIAMDIKAPWAKYPLLTGTSDCPVEKVKESVKIIFESGIPYQFRTTRVDPLLTAEDYEEIRRLLPAGCKHVWQRFRAEYSYDPALRGGK